MYNPVLPISHEEISYKDYDLIFLYDTHNKFFALLLWWTYDWEITQKLKDTFDIYDIQPTFINNEDPAWEDIPNTSLLDFIMDNIT